MFQLCINQKQQENQSASTQKLLHKPTLNQKKYQMKDIEDKRLSELATLPSTKTERRRIRCLAKEEIHHYQYVGDIADWERNYHV